MKIIKKIKVNKEYEVSFLRFTLLQYGCKSQQNKKEKYLNLFPSRSFKEMLLDNIISLFKGKNHDYVYIVRVNAMGEAYLLSAMINNLIKEHNIKNVAIVAVYKPVKEVFELFCPDIPCYYTTRISMKTINPLLTSKELIYKNIHFFVFPNTFPDACKLYTDYSQNKEKLIFTEKMQQEYGATAFCNVLPRYKTQDMNISSVIGNLNLSKFAFLIPEANSVLLLSDDFWKKLRNMLNEKGFDVFVNTTNKNCPLGEFPKLTIAQSVYLASLSKMIISLRCGFLELLSANNVPKFVIYTRRKRDAVLPRKMQKIFSLKNYPCVDSKTIVECNTEDMNENQILDCIAKLIETWR